MTTNAASQPHPSVARAAFRALAAWLAIYVIISQLLVIPKWISLSKIEQEVVIVETTPKTDVVDNAAAEQAKQETIQQQKQRIRLIKRLVDDAKEVESRHEQVVTSTAQHLEDLRSRVMKPLSRGQAPKQPSLTSPELIIFKELMELPTLSNVDESRLLELSDGMQKEVDAIVKTNATISWQEVTEVVTARYQRQDPTRTCPSSPRQEIDSSFARESHLYQKFQQAEKILKHRAELVPPLLHRDTVVRHALQEQASNPPPAPEVKETDEHDDRMCVSQQDVLDMMDEGLNALQRRLDLRRVLTKYVLATYDVDKSGVILDAPLDPPTRTLPMTRDTLNLRQVLDTPLLKEVETWVDAAIDLVGGHFDTLDQLVDKLAADDSSAGKALVTKLHTLAGKVEIPNLWAKVPTKAGILRPGEQ